MNTITIQPAYGRDYRTKGEIEQSFACDEDWLINSFGHPYDGKPCTPRRDLAGETVKVRYNQDRYVFATTFPKEIAPTKPMKVKPRIEPKELEELETIELEERIEFRKHGKQDAIFDAIRWVASAVYKDSDRGALCCVHSDGENLVGSNGKTLHVYRSSALPEGNWKVIKLLKTKVIFELDKSGAKYPNWRNVTFELPKSSFSIDAPGSNPELREAYAMSELIKRLPGDFDYRLLAGLIAYGTKFEVAQSSESEALMLQWGKGKDWQARAYAMPLRPRTSYL